MFWDYAPGAPSAAGGGGGGGRFGELPTLSGPGPKVSGWASAVGAGAQPVGDHHHHSGGLLAGQQQQQQHQQQQQGKRPVPGSLVGGAKQGQQQQQQQGAGGGKQAGGRGRRSKQEDFRAWCEGTLRGIKPLEDYGALIDFLVTLPSAGEVRSAAPRPACCSPAPLALTITLFWPPTHPYVFSHVSWPPPSLRLHYLPGNFAPLEAPAAALILPPARLSAQK